ncbi:MAG TPA: hypothetical protein VGC76_02090 [Pyrinomonadaceae bacterium]|jgi:hypothetical protein
MAETENEGAPEQLGGGAQFWTVVATDSKPFITAWKVILSQNEWSDSMSSDNPTQGLKTPGLSGVFNVSVSAEGPDFTWQELSAKEGCQANIGCNSNCASMVSMSASPDGKSATYCTTWDAACS